MAWHAPNVPRSHRNSYPSHPSRKLVLLNVSMTYGYGPFKQLQERAKRRLRTAWKTACATSAPERSEVSDLPRSARMRSLVASPTGTATRTSGTRRVIFCPRPRGDPQPARMTIREGAVSRGLVVDHCLLAASARSCTQWPRRLLRTEQ